MNQTIIVVVAILAITALLSIALINGINGLILASGLTAIAGLGGYTIGKKK